MENFTYPRSEKENENLKKKYIFKVILIGQNLNEKLKIPDVHLSHLTAGHTNFHSIVVTPGNAITKSVSYVYS